MDDEARPSPRALALSLVGLAIFLSWQALALRSYLRADTRPPSWEAAANLQVAFDWREAAASVPRTAASSPFYFMLLGRASAGCDPAVAGLWLNWFSLALLSIAVFGLAWHFRPNETALLSVVIFVGSPVLQELFHTQSVDLALAAWAAAGYWALLRSDEFRKWPASLAFGAVFAVGMLHGLSFATYFLPVVYLGLAALSRPNSRLKVLAAAAIALSGSLPWYAAHLPVLLARLSQVPVISVSALWQDWTILSYLGPMANGLGAPFFACALLGLCVPQYRRNWHCGWVLVAWFVSSYVLWSLLPISRLRYILPCLPALAVAGLGAWPRGLLWALAAVQIFTMVNFNSGWLSQVSVPLSSGSLLLFPSQPPVRQDWALADILRQAQARRDPQRPFANLTLVANDERFNQSNFELTARRLGIRDVHLRQPGPRLCEFSQFVVLKDGFLGPALLVGKLPEAAKVIKDPLSWFSGAYKEARRWPLPDNSTAVLYEQKHFVASPAKAGRYKYQFFATDQDKSAGADMVISSGEYKIEGTDMAIEFGGWDAQRSVFRSAKASAAEFRVGALRLAGVRMEAEGLLFVPLYEHGADTWGSLWGDLRFLKLDTLRIKSLRVSAESLRVVLEQRFKRLRISELELDKTVKLRGRLCGIQFSAEVAARLEASPPALRCDVIDARLGETPVPAFFLAPFRTFLLPLTPTTETPFAIEAPGLTLSGGWLSVP